MEHSNKGTENNGKERLPYRTDTLGIFTSRHKHIYKPIHKKNYHTLGLIIAFNNTTII